MCARAFLPCVFSTTARIAPVLSPYESTRNFTKRTTVRLDAAAIIAQIERSFGLSALRLIAAAGNPTAADQTAMPRLKPATQRARRENILDAAEICFARSGFHGCTMHDICKEAGISSGALYVYFVSKETLIAGIADRDRAKLADQLADVAKAPDLMEALTRLGEHYMTEEPHYKRLLGIEIGCEATRNAAVGEVYRSVDDYCMDAFKRLFERAAAEGKIAPTYDASTIARVLAVIGDGLMWRSAVDRDFDTKSVLPAITAMVSMLLNPTPGTMPAAAELAMTPGNGARK